jgi:glycosyltransferase involved in cell wall biosynthesis
MSSVLQSVTTFMHKASKTLYHSSFNSLARASLRRDLTSATRRIGGNPSFRIVSYFGWQNGISAGALLQQAALSALGYKAEVVDVTPAMNNPFAPVECTTADFFIIHCGVEQFLRVAWPIRRMIPRARVAFYLAWELSNPPNVQQELSRCWDELWTPSLHSARALSQWCTNPVRIVPHILLRDGTTPRRWQKGSEPLRFLTMADARSSLSRKNPYGAVKAFKLAFPRTNDVELIVKLHKTDIRGSDELDRLLAEIKLDSRIRLINKTMTPDDIDRLLLFSHVLVSLHRAEGFGIPLLEAQTHGLATIATAWSGNLDFTTNETGFLIPYTLTRMHDFGGVYGDVTWADPDTGLAAHAMRELYDNPGTLARMAAAACHAHKPQKQLHRFEQALNECISPSLP